jgi:hypothetical protein
MERILCACDLEEDLSGRGGEIEYVDSGQMAKNDYQSHCTFTFAFEDCVIRNS